MAAEAVCAINLASRTWAALQSDPRLRHQFNINDVLIFTHSTYEYLNHPKFTLANSWRPLKIRNPFAASLTEMSVVGIPTGRILAKVSASINSLLNILRLYESTYQSMCLPRSLMFKSCSWMIMQQHDGPEPVPTSPFQEGGTCLKSAIPSAREATTSAIRIT